jgi:hypothetical protein
MKQSPTLASVVVLSAMTICSSGHANPVDDAIRNAVQANGYEYSNPPSTQGMAGSLYVKMKTTSGKLTPQHICDLFPNLAPGDSAADASKEVWPSNSSQTDSGFSFFASLTKAFSFVTGGNIGASMKDVRKITITWGNVKSMGLLLQGLHAPGTAADATYKGARNGACFNEANTLLAKHIDVYMASKVATVESLDAKVEVNPDVQKPQPAASGTTGTAPTGGSTGKAAAATGKAAPVANGKAAAATTAKAASGDAGGLTTGVGQAIDAVAKAAKNAVGSGNTANAGANAGNGAPDKPSCSTTGENAFCGGVNILGLLNLNFNAGWKQTSSDTLTFTQPFNVGFQYLWVKDLKKSGYFAPPETQVHYVTGIKDRLKISDGSIPSADVANIHKLLKTH